MEDIISEALQSLLNAQELLDARFREAPTDQNRRALGSRPLRAPPASKQLVENLPTMIVSEETLMKLGIDTECAVCNENLVINDKMQELPCKHLFHPLCLMPWLNKRNSCPVCRHELPTDNQVYESWKESEKVAEKTRRDAANSVC
ncbi:hypothetical protein MKX03_028379 [Papaver bracteatum]|nr:hypothetical protein MKX03_028379 [Papaver bracteatum]